MVTPSSKGKKTPIDAPGTLPPAANESREKRIQRPIVPDLLVPPFNKLPQYIRDIENEIGERSQEISQDDAQQLVINVQIAQRNLTESLNALSAYRKAAARILESRRREAAQIRKANNAKGTSRPGALEVNNEDSVTGL